MQEEAPGLVFWHPKGWALWQAVEQYMRRVYRDNGYQEVRGPQILDRSLWETHRPLGKLPRQHVHHLVGEPRLRGEADELPGPHPDLQQGRAQLPRPAAALRRVRLLPPQRALRRAARPDARARLRAGRRPHLLHRGADPRASASPSPRCCRRSTRDFGFTDIIYKVATRPAKRIGSDESWDRAEQALQEALQKSGVQLPALARRRARSTGRRSSTR